MPFKDLPEGQTNYCKACELEKRNPGSNFKPLGHTCGYDKCRACEWDAGNRRQAVSPKHTCGKETKEQCTCGVDYNESFEPFKVDCKVHDEEDELRLKKEYEPKPSWEEEFDSMYGLGEDKDMLFLNYDEDATKIIKDFIHQIILKEREQAVREYKDKLEYNIGLLRQWLNEDRIDSASKMVSSEQLKKWLMN